MFWGSGKEVVGFNFIGNAKNNVQCLWIWLRCYRTRRGVRTVHVSKAKNIEGPIRVRSNPLDYPRLSGIKYLCFHSPTLHKITTQAVHPLTLFLLITKSKAKPLVKVKNTNCTNKRWYFGLDFKNQLYTIVNLHIIGKYVHDESNQRAKFKTFTTKTYRQTIHKRPLIIANGFLLGWFQASTYK